MKNEAQNPIKIGSWTREWLESKQLPHYYSDSLPSTNGIAKEAAMRESTPKIFYVTEDQTAGRGQGSRSWFNTAAGTNLLLTVSLESASAPQPETCLAFGEHLKEACETLWPQLQWNVKPPNDLMLDHQKVAGILLEVISQGPQNRILLGLGFNVLAHPVNPEFEATDLQNHLTETLTKSQWFEFLELVFNRPDRSLEQVLGAHA